MRRLRGHSSPIALYAILPYTLYPIPFILSTAMTLLQQRHTGTGRGVVAGVEPITSIDEYYAHDDETGIVVASCLRQRRWIRCIRIRRGVWWWWVILMALVVVVLLRVPSSLFLLRRLDQCVRLYWFQAPRTTSLIYDPYQGHRELPRK